MRFLRNRDEIEGCGNAGALHPGEQDFRLAGRLADSLQQAVRFRVGETVRLATRGERDQT